MNQAQAKIIAPFMPISISDIEQQAPAFCAAPLDMIEWRADYFLGDILTAVPLIQKLFETVPLIFTLRTSAQGGLYAGTDYADNCRNAILSAAFQLIDIEYGHEQSGQLIAEAKAHGVGTILSWHDFTDIPSRQELSEIYAYALRQRADILKIAFMPSSSDEIAVVAEILEALNIEMPLIAVAMGEHGRISRVIPELLHSSATFAAVAGASAPGQIDIYRLKALLCLSVEERKRSLY